MKIREILNEDLVDPEYRERTVSTPFNLKKLGKRTEYYANRDKGGAYATGTPDPKDPFMFRKKMRQPSKLDMDAYYQYLKFIQPFADENPFFPKVYSIDVKTDPNGIQKPSYKLEKLTSLTDAEKQTSYQLEEILSEKYLNFDVDEYSATLFRTIRYSLRDQSYLKYIKDEKLKEAIEVIRYFLEKHPYFNEDLHRGNMMIRFTSTGPQLVFTDPVQDSGESIVGYNVFKGGWPANPNALKNMDDWKIQEKMDILIPKIKKEKANIISSIAGELDSETENNPEVQKKWDSLREFNDTVQKWLLYYNPRRLQSYAISFKELNQMSDDVTIDMLPKLYANRFDNLARKEPDPDTRDMLIKLAAAVADMKI